MSTETPDLEAALRKVNGSEERARPDETIFAFLVQMDILRQANPAEYEQAKKMKVTVNFRSETAHDSNYTIGCTIDGMIREVNAHWDIQAKPEEVDKVLREDVKRLLDEGFTNIHYQGYVT